MCVIPPPGYCSRSIGKEILSLAPEITEQVVVQWEANVTCANCYNFQVGFLFRRKTLNIA